MPSDAEMLAQLKVMTESNFIPHELWTAARWAVRRIAELEGALRATLAALPLDTISSTVWDDDEGTIIYHQWYLDADAALAPATAKEGEAQGG